MTRTTFPVESYRCLCGLSLWAVERTTHPALWATHLAHIEAFQRQPPRRPKAGTRPERNPS